MVYDPIGPLTTADTLLTTSVSLQSLTVPPELASVLYSPSGTWASAGRCIAKPTGQLLFVLNSVQDLGFPAALDFDIGLVGTVLQPATPSKPFALIQFDVNQVVKKTFTLPGGLAVRVDTVTGKITPEAGVIQPPFAGTSCSGQPREINAWLGWLRGFGGPFNPGTDLTLMMFIDGQERTLTLSVNALVAHSGELGFARVPQGPVYTRWWEILLEHLPMHGGPPPPPPWRQAMQDALVGLASAQLAWATSPADRRHLQQAAVSAVEAALGRMRGIVDQEG